MMQEIYQRGPIGCSVVSNPSFRNYTGGVYEDTQGYSKNSTNHVVSIVGWGVENGQKYWIGRNSWGTYWGEEGFFRIVRGSNNIKVESNCTWGVPKDTWSTKKFSDKLVEGVSSNLGDYGVLGC